MATIRTPRASLITRYRNKYYYHHDEASVDTSTTMVDAAGGPCSIPDLDIKAELEKEDLA